MTELLLLLPGSLAGVEDGVRAWRIVMRAKGRLGTGMSFHHLCQEWLAVAALLMAYR